LCKKTGISGRGTSERLLFIMLICRRHHAPKAASIVPTTHMSILHFYPVLSGGMGSGGEKGDSRRASGGEDSGHAAHGGTPCCKKPGKASLPERRAWRASQPMSWIHLERRRSGRHAGWMARFTQGCRLGRSAEHGVRKGPHLAAVAVRWRRMRWTTRGSVINETIRMRAPQEQTRGRSRKFSGPRAPMYCGPPWTTPQCPILM